MTMRLISTACTLLCLFAFQARSQDEASLRSTIEAHYSAINGEEGEVRNSQDLEIITSQHLPNYTLFPWHGGLLREGGWREAARRMGANVEFQAAANLRMTSFRTRFTATSPWQPSTSLAQSAVKASRTGSHPSGLQ